MSVVRLVPPSESPAGRAVGRAQALLGDRPTVILVADEASPDCCYTARLVRAGEAWFGVVSDRALFTDRVRLGMMPRFMVSDGDVVTVQGSTKTRVLGRLASQHVELQATLAPVLGAYRSDDDVVIEVVPQQLTVVEDEEA